MTKTKNALKATEREQSNYAYDKTFAHYNDKIAGSTKYEDRKVAKTARNITNYKEEQTNVVLSSQAVGWRPDIDTFRLDFARRAECHHTFFNKGHL